MIAGKNPSNKYGKVAYGRNVTGIIGVALQSMAAGTKSNMP
jgi:hypothetical protein